VWCEEDKEVEEKADGEFRRTAQTRIAGEVWW
jgi:hypothetical protein